METRQIRVTPENVLTRIQLDVEAVWGSRPDYEEMAGDTQLMQRASNPKELESNWTRQQELIDDFTAPWKINKGGKKRKTEILSQNVEMSKTIAAEETGRGRGQKEN